VGGTWLLANAPGKAGVYLGLTGEPMRAADAIFARFSDGLVPSAKLQALVERLTDQRGGPVGEAIGSLAEDPGESELARRRGAIDKAFAGADIETIHMALAGVPDEWAANSRAALVQKSPKALKLTLAAIRQARRLASLDEALKVEYRLTVRLFEDGEFPEGVRALLIDKDRKPKWSPPQLGEVTPELTARYLAALPADEELTF
jgi:enoyl-CoA hydratase